MLVAQCGCPQREMVALGEVVRLDEGRQDTGDQIPQLGLAHRFGRHYSVTVGGVVMNGRTSSHSWIGSPPAPGAADNSPASSTARS